MCICGVKRLPANVNANVGRSIMRICENRQKQNVINGPPKHAD